MDPFQKNQVGTTGLSITRLGFGGGTLGDPVDILDESQAWDTMSAAYEGGVRHFDSAPWYGLTISEHRLDRYLGTQPRDSYTVSTKVGRVMFAPDDPVAFQDSRWLKRWKGGLPFDLRFDYTRDWRHARLRGQPSASRRQLGRCTGNSRSRFPGIAWTKPALWRVSRN